ncbi:MAG: FAD-dependent oxidoreductase, partial [Phycisphaerales bacterium]
MQDARSVLVIGAGIAGATAAHRLSQAGLHVHLIDKEASIGGHVVKMGCKATDVCLRCNVCVANELLRTVSTSQEININTRTQLSKLEAGANG